MTEIRWRFIDPVIDSIDVAQYKEGLSVIKLRPHEKSPGSLKKVVRAKLIDLGIFFDRQIAIETWNPAKNRKTNMRAETIISLNTCRKEYPDRVKVEFEYA